MNAVIRPGTLRGSVRVPASKSAAHRALIAAALADGLTTIHINALNDEEKQEIDKHLDSIHTEMEGIDKVIENKKGSVL